MLDQVAGYDSLFRTGGQGGKVYDMTIPTIVRTGSMGSAKTLQIATNRSEIVSWADRAYDDARFFSCAASFNMGEYPPVYYPIYLFVFIATEHNSGANVDDAYIYARDVGKSRAETRWSLVALGLQAIVDKTATVECAYFDSGTASVSFCDRHGKVNARMLIPDATRYMKKLSHI